jgi:GNAT superfamily N-acetyltransferase
MRLVEVTDNGGSIIEFEWLIKAEEVHRQLRPMLPADYVARMHVVFANGARLLVAEHECQIVGLAVWRLIENTYEGSRLYIDDLVVDEKQRSKGTGKILLQHLETKAKDFGCHILALDSGVQRAAAHKFYFREEMHISSFCFRKSL